MPTSNPQIDDSPLNVWKHRTIGLFTLPVHAAFVAVFPELTSHEDTLDFVGAVAECLYADLESVETIPPDTYGAFAWAADEWWETIDPSRLAAAALAANPGVRVVANWALSDRPTP